MQLSHIGQIALAVAVVDRSEAFYADVVDLRKLCVDHALTTAPPLAEPWMDRLNWIGLVVRDDRTFLEGPSLSILAQRIMAG